MHYSKLNGDFFKLRFESLSTEARTVDEIDKFKSFELKYEVLYYNGKVYVLKFGKHKLNIVNNLHDISIANHQCFQETYMAIKRHYYWLGMKNDVKEYIDRCLKCQV